MCDGLQGYIQTDNTGFLIQPSGTNSTENNIKYVTDVHTLSIIPEFKQLKVIGQNYFLVAIVLYKYSCHQACSAYLFRASQVVKCESLICWVTYGYNCTIMF